MQAYRIVNWWKYEMLKNGKLATVKTRQSALRLRPLIYVRFAVHGHILTADYRRMVKRAGDMAAACDGLYKMLVGLAGNQSREYRGWVLDDRQRPMNPGQVAELLCLSEIKVGRIFEILLDREVKWVEIMDFPEALDKSFAGSDLTGVPKSGESGNNQEKKGSPLIETETEVIKLSDSKRIESKEGVREKSGLPPAPAQASVTVTGSGTVSDSQRLSDSGSGTVSDSVSQPGRGRGEEEGEELSRDEIFSIGRDCKAAVLEFSQIISVRNNSDMTTINDIFSQLQQRILARSPHKLFELALNTARQCWRADKPIAMFVAAMKKPPFHYVPKKLNVIPAD